MVSYLSPFASTSDLILVCSGRLNFLLKIMNKKAIETTIKVEQLFNELNILTYIFGVPIYLPKQWEHRRIIPYLYTVWILIYFSFTTFFIIYVFSNYRTSFSQSEPLTYSINWIQQILGYAIMFSTFVQAIFNRNNIMDLFNQLNYINDEHLKYKIFQDEHQQLSNNEFKRLRIKIGIECLTVILLLVLFYIQIASFYGHFKTIVLIIYEFIVTIYPIVVMVLYQLCFINLCTLINHYLKEITKIITSPCSQNVKKVAPRYELRTKDIYHISKLYDSIYHSAEQINIIFGLFNFSVLSK